VLLNQFLMPPKPSAPTALFSPSPSPWQPLAHQPPFNAGAMLLLTDGTLIVQDQGAMNSGSADWWRLPPDINGSYLNGTWSQVASLPAGYAPEYFDTAVLPDGRIIIEGGNYNNGKQSSATLGAIYDPLANQWTPVPSPPIGAGSPIGGAGTVLANGTFMTGGDNSTRQALFNPANLSWTITGAGKADPNEEETRTLLPSGNVLTVDAKNPGNLTNAELYSPNSGGWATAGSTIVKLDDTNANGSGTHELGTQILRPDGTVFVTGTTRDTPPCTALVREPGRRDRISR
jgi:hypothetical protein